MTPKEFFCNVREMMKASDNYMRTGDFFYAIRWSELNKLVREEIERVNKLEQKRDNQ